MGCREGCDAVFARRAARGGWWKGDPELRPFTILLLSQVLYFKQCATGTPTCCPGREAETVVFINVQELCMRNQGSNLLSLCGTVGRGRRRPRSIP